MLKNQYPHKSAFTLVIALALLAGSPGSAQTQGQPQSPEEVVELSPFLVSSERDYGYRATNSMTATRAGVPILKTPLNISVLTEEFINDINAQYINDALNYISSVSTTTLGNNGRFGGSGDGPKLRGFSIQFNLRNGYRREGGVTVRNVERIEVVKGPVSQLFGQTAPGGLINYITKRPKFKDAAAITATVGSNNLVAGEIDVERSFSLGRSERPNAGVRIMTYSEDRDLYRDYEFSKDRYLIAQFAWEPFKSLNVLVEHEFLDRESNLAQGLPHGNSEWSAAWAKAVAEGRTADATRWYGSQFNWIDDVYARTGSRPAASRDFAEKSYPEGELLTYNLSGPDTRFNSTNHSTSVEVDWKPKSWFSARYGFNRNQLETYEKFMFTDFPNADNTWAMSFSSRNDRKIWTTHQWDGVVSWDTTRLKSKFIVGLELLETYDTIRRFTFDANKGFAAQGITRLTPAPSQPDRGAAGNAVASYDPRTMLPVRLDLSIVNEDRPQDKRINVLDRTGYYVSYRGSALNDRLNVSAGMRWEEADTDSFTPFTGSRTLSSVKEKTPTYGVSYSVLPSVVAFASYSESFSPSTGRTASGPLARPDEIMPLPNETGKGIEAGIKIQLRDETLSGTLSYFEVTRSNISTLDVARTDADPRNADPSRPTGTKFPYDVSFFSSAAEAMSRGIEAEAVWSPKRNLQFLVSINHFISAELQNTAPIQGTGRLADGSTVRFPDFPANGAKLSRAPRWAGSIWGKYTFTTGRLSGLNIGLGVRHKGEATIFEFGNPRFTVDERFYVASAHTITDLSLNYPATLFGLKTNLNFSVKNLFDKEYIDGTYTPGWPRRFSLSTIVRF